MGERDDPCIPFFVLPSFFLLFLSGRWRDILFVYQSGGVCEKPKTMGAMYRMIALQICWMKCSLF